MPKLLPTLVLSTLALASAAPSAAVAARSIHDPTGYPLVWNQPGAERATVREGVVFGRPAGRDLALDLYLPAEARPRERRPAVVFLSGFGDDPGAPLRSWEIYRSWMRTVAARGYAGVMGESDPADVTGSLSALFRFLGERGGELGVDAGRLAVFACSANVQGALPFLMGEGAPRGLAAAALLYGSGEPAAIRADLPVLLVIAGHDGPELIEAERALAGRARAAGAPWTLIEAPRLAHAFDAFDRSPASLAAIAQVLAFLDAHLEPPPELAPESDESRAAREALGHLYGREFEAAHDYYNERVEGPAHDDRQAWENLAWARRGMGSPVGELVALEQAVRVAPEDWTLRRRYLRLAARLSGWQQVEESMTPVESSTQADATDLGLLGLARLHLQRPADAVAPLERAVALGGEPGTRYNLACAYARTGRLEAAFTALGGALDAGFADASAFATDPDLEPLRADPRFAELSRRAAAAAAPPTGTPHE